MRKTLSTRKHWVALSLIFGVATSAHAADGVIHFVGAIVAAQYELRSTSKPLETTKSGHQTHFTFVRQHIDRPSASVRVETPDQRALSTRFADSHGHTRHIDRKNWHAIGQDGGTLSLEVAPAPEPRAPLIALVSISYD